MDALLLGMALQIAELENAGGGGRRVRLRLSLQAVQPWPLKKFSGTPEPGREACRRGDEGKPAVSHC